MLNIYPILNVSWLTDLAGIWVVKQSFLLGPVKEIQAKKHCKGGATRIRTCISVPAELISLYITFIFSLFKSDLRGCQQFQYDREVTSRFQS